MIHIETYKLSHLFINDQDEKIKFVKKALQCVKSNFVS